MLNEMIDIIGPVWPLIFGVAVFQGALLLFGLLSLQFYPVENRDAEKWFLRSLDKANSAVAAIGLLGGFLGTYLGLLAALPELRNVIQGEGTQATARIITGLQQAFGSSVAGLIVGGMAGSLNEFILHLLVPMDESETVPRNGTSFQLKQWLQRLVGKNSTSNGSQRNSDAKNVNQTPQQKRGAP